MSRPRSSGSRAPGPRALRRRAAPAALAGALALVVAAPGPGAIAPEVAIAEAGERQARIERHLVLAQYYQLRKRDLDAAATEYRRVLDIDRGHVQAALALADIHRQRGKAKRAVKLLERMARRRARDPKVASALARARQAAGDADGARRALERAVKLAPGDGGALWRLVEHLEHRYRAGEDELEADLARAARRYRDRSGGGAHADEVDALLVELEGDPVDRAVFRARRAYDKAFTERRIGRINAHMATARRGFETCLERAPDRDECHYYLGLVLSSVKASDHYDLDEARAHLEKADSIPDAHVELAVMHRKADDLPAAARALARALAVDADHARAHLELGIVHKLDGRTKRAVRELAKAARADPGSPHADKAVGELTTLAPDHPLVKSSTRFGRIKGDVFSTEKFKSAVEMLERQMGGVAEGAPEERVLEAMASRIARAADVAPEHTFRVSVLRTGMVNAFAMPNGNIYFTRGFLEFMKKTWPDRPIDVDHDVIAHVMAHEIAHVISRHTVRTLVFRAAARESSRSINPSVLTHVTRLHEIEADRQGMVMAFLAGYHPRGGIAFMEAQGKRREIPEHLDHPTYDERVQYLEEYWSNDVKYAYMSFRFGVDAMAKARAAEGRSLEHAAHRYREAIEHFKRYGATLKPTVEILNNSGIAYTKLGLYELARRESPLLRWQTEFSVEREQALAYVSVMDEEESRTRGAGGSGRKPIPWQLKRASELFRRAMAERTRYARAHLNLAAVYLAVGRDEQAADLLGSIPEGAETDRGSLANLRGIVFAERKQYPRAARAFRAAIRHRGSNQAACYNLARLYDTGGKRKKARALYKTYLRHYPKGPWAAAARRALASL